MTRVVAMWELTGLQRRPRSGRPPVEEVDGAVAEGGRVYIVCTHQEVTVAVLVVVAVDGHPVAGLIPWRLTCQDRVGVSEAAGPRGYWTVDDVDRASQAVRASRRTDGKVRVPVGVEIAVAHPTLGKFV